MSVEIKTIGILTSGGDAPGMNAAVRAAGISESGGTSLPCSTPRIFFSSSSKDTLPLP